MAVLDAIINYDENGIGHVRIDALPTGSGISSTDGEETLTVWGNKKENITTKRKDFFTSTKTAIYQLKQLEANIAKQVTYHNQLVQSNTAAVRAISNKLIGITSDIIKKQQQLPTVTDKAHWNNKQLEAEAALMGLRRLQAEEIKKKNKAEAELKAAKAKFEAENKKLKEEEKKRKEEEKKEKEEWEALDIYQKNIVLAEREIIKSSIKVKLEDDNISSLNKKINLNKNKINTLNNSLSPIKKEIDRLNVIKKGLEIQVKNTLPLINDPNRYRIHFTAKQNLENIKKGLATQQNNLSNLQKQIDQLKKDNENINKQISDSKIRKLAAEKEYRDNQIRLKDAKDKLKDNNLKNLFIDYLENFKFAGEIFEKQFEEMAANSREKIKKSKIEKLTVPLEKYGKYFSDTRKAFSPKDIFELTEYLKSIKYDEWASVFKNLTKGLDFAGNLNTIYETTNELIHAIDTGDWKPFFLEIEKQFLNKAAIFVLMAMVSRVGIKVTLTAMQRTILYFITTSVVNWMVENYIEDLNKPILEKIINSK